MKLGTDANGHITLDGARWHSPSKDEPKKCKEPGCTYVMKGPATLVPVEQEPDNNT